MPRFASYNVSITAYSDREELRSLMRKQRRQVVVSDRRDAAKAFARAANRAMLLRPALRIGVYQAYGHEADMSAVTALARRRGCELYLPRVTDQRRNRMQFVPFDDAAVLRPNAFGILEPRGSARPVRVRDLDLIFVPLVAFDSCGWRLGSGAGFYDRRLHHLQAGRKWRRPRLIGIAYEFQRVARLNPHRWDIPLDAVITERGVHYTQIHRGGPCA